MKTNIIHTILLASAVLGGHAAAAVIVPTTGLVGYYDFEGGTLGNRATAVGSTAPNQLGALTALTFGTGANPVVTTSGAAVFNNAAGAAVLGYLKLAVPFGTNAGTNALGPNFTVSAFYRTDVPAGTTRQMVLESDTGFDVSYSVNNGTATRGQTFTETANMVFSGATGGISPALPGFDNITLTYSSNGTNTTVLTYLNGNLVGTPLAPLSSTVGDVGLVFGTYRGEDSRAFDGTMDHIAIYNRTLSASEVASIAIPEPSAVLLGAIGSLALLRRRRN